MNVNLFKNVVIILFTDSKLLAHVLSPLNDVITVNPAALIKCFTSKCIEIAFMNLVTPIITEVLRLKHGRNKQTSSLRIYFLLSTCFSALYTDSISYCIK